MTDKARWFNQTGVCRCGRIAVGILMDDFNSPIGPACKACANKRIEAERQKREINQGLLALHASLKANGL
jgi:hypothetical protein